MEFICFIAMKEKVSLGQSVAKLSFSLLSDSHLRFHKQALATCVCTIPAHDSEKVKAAEVCLSEVSFLRFLSLKGNIMSNESSLSRRTPSLAVSAI